MVEFSEIYKRVSINEKFDKIDGLNFIELCELKENIFELANEYMKKEMIFYCNPFPFQKDIDNVNSYIKKINLTNYYQKLCISENEIINGYKLYNCSEPIMSYDIYLDFFTIWQDVDNLSFDEFIEKYEENACSEWSRMNEHGEYPENAGLLSRTENGEKLWKLPYPKKFVLETIEIGCNNHQESVRYSNFLCEWMKRKIYQDKHTVPSLKNICIKFIKKSGKYKLDILPNDLIENFK